ncbi:MAG: hypothetical protein CM1200mP38_4190 [Dehalococcoidia bacterium]|nr:MAG: hypothetical protein CM1200mP38_4190 [Dehalococcoidia bacterium]
MANKKNHIVSDPFLSIIVPTFNESAEIHKTLKTIKTFLDSQIFSWEIIIVDDGSNDNTTEIVEASILENRNFHLIKNSHLGKGAAVRTGMLAAKGELRLMCDADLSMPVNFIDNFIQSYQDGFDITIGSREIEGSKRFEEPHFRHVRGRIFNFWLRLLGINKFQDTQCGFKSFSAPIANFLFKQLEIVGFGFDVELMHIASKQNQIKIQELPIEWHHNLNSKVRPFRDPFLMIRDSIKVKWKNFKGKYNSVYRSENQENKYNSKNSIFVVIPTFNEAENISELTSRLINLDLTNLRIIFIDDNSPDGTSEAIKRVSEKFETNKIQLIRRARKSGLGSAYIEGFTSALNQGAEIIVQMDADLSHKPEYVKELINHLTNNDCVVGSRYIEGGGLDKNWDFKRKMLSSIANFGIRLAAGIKTHDATSGFKAYRSESLKQIDFSTIQSNGFGFQAEIAFIMEHKNFRIKEYPITFFDRLRGDSKMSINIIFEALWRLSTLRILNKIRKPTV